jgi:hypothetical protein
VPGIRGTLARRRLDAVNPMRDASATKSHNSRKDTHGTLEEVRHVLIIEDLNIDELVAPSLFGPRFGRQSMTFT